MRTITVLLLLALAAGVQAWSDAPFLFEKEGTLPPGIRYELKVREGPYRPCPIILVPTYTSWQVTRKANML